MRVGSFFFSEIKSEMKIIVMRACRKIKRRMRKIFFAPIPQTAPLEVYLAFILPTAQFLKRVVALATAIIYFTTQIVFAQSVVMAMPHGAVPQFLHSMKLRSLNLFHSGKVVFHALPFGFDYQREDRERAGYQSPERTMEKEAQQQQRMETTDLLEQQRNAQNPNSGRGSATQYNQTMTPDQFMKNMQSMEGIQGEIARMSAQTKQDVSAGVGSYVLYKDGRQVFFKNGLTFKILNEKVLDAKGNVTLRNTTNMQYNSKKLLVSYIVESTDSQGNVTLLQRKNIQYTADSVYYAGKDTNAKQKITSYEENTVDPIGNLTTVQRSNIQYDALGRITSYDQQSTDA